MGALLVVVRDDNDMTSDATTARDTFNFQEISTVGLRADNKELMAPQTGAYNLLTGVQEAFPARVRQNVYSAVFSHAPSATGAQTGYMQAGTIRSLAFEATMPAAWSGSTGKIDITAQRVNAYSVHKQQITMHHT